MFPNGFVDVNKQTALVCIRISMEEPRYYLPTEVVLHNKPNDIWVSLLGRVYDVTSVVKEFKHDRITKALLAHAGKDISKWFDRRTNDLKQVVHPVTWLKVDYIPHGPIPDCNPVVPSSKWKPLEAQMRPIDGRPWWLDKSREVGRLTRKARPVRIMNVLAPASHRTNLIWVASEETLSEIVKRIEHHNSHARSYTLKFEGRVLHPMKTLDENNIPDERDKFMQLGLTDDNYIPAIALYYNDDLTRK